MINTLIKILFLFTCLMCFSQQEVLPSGGDAKSANGSFSYSIGQILISQMVPSNNIWEDENISISHGVQQLFIPSCEKNGNVTIKASPNPSKGLVNITLSAWDEIELKLSVYDMLGRKFLSQVIKEEETQLDLSYLNSGVYLIAINNICGSTSTFKLIINNY